MTGRRRARALAVLLIVVPFTAEAAVTRLVDPFVWKIHVEVANQLDEDSLREIVERASWLLQADQEAGPGDLPCCARFEAIELQTFGTIGDGLDVISNQIEWDALASPGAYIVADLEYCGSFDPSILGCADTPGSKLVVGLDAGPNDEHRFATLIAHERGHNKGLGHRPDIAGCAVFPDNQNVMAPCLDYIRQGRVTLGECNSYRSGSAVIEGWCACHTTLGGEAQPDGTSCGGGTCRNAGLCLPRHANDQCVTAQVIAADGQFSGTLLGSTSDSPPPGLFGQRPDVWYEHVAWCGGSLLIDQCGAATDFSGSVAITDTCPSGESLRGWTSTCLLGLSVESGESLRIRLMEGGNAAAPVSQWPYEEPDYSIELTCSPDTTDTDGDGLWDWIEYQLIGSSPFTTDSDGDSLSDLAEVGSLANESAVRAYLQYPADLDGDGLHDPVDVDDDGDGRYTASELGVDVDNDGIDDSRDIWMNLNDASLGLGETVGGVQFASNDGVLWIAIWSAIATPGASLQGDADILFARSLDGGASWSAALPVLARFSADVGEDIEPTIVATGGDSFVVAWTTNETLGHTIESDYDITVTSTADGGANWSAPTLVDPGAASDAGDDREPVLVMDGAGVIALFWSRESGPGRDSDVAYSISSDGGSTFSVPAYLDGAHTSDTGDDVMPTALGLGPGHFVVAWASNGDQGGALGHDFDILLAMTHDGGATWSVPSAVDAAANSDAGDDLAPVLAGWTSQRLIAVWTSNDARSGILGVDFDLLWAQSLDEGISWSGMGEIARVARNDHGDDESPDAAATPSGSIAVVWNSTDPGRAGSGADADIRLGTLAYGGSQFEVFADPIHSDGTVDDVDDELPRLEMAGDRWMLAWGHKASDGVHLVSSAATLLFSSPGGDPVSLPMFDGSGRLLFVAILVVVGVSSAWSRMAGQRTQAPSRISVWTSQSGERLEGTNERKG